MKLQKYITETKVYYLSGKTDSNCNSITFFNTGSQVVVIDGITLKAGQQLAITGSFAEINIKQYDFAFKQVAGAINSLTIVYKKYI